MAVIYSMGLTIIIDIQSARGPSHVRSLPVQLAGAQPSLPQAAAPLPLSLLQQRYFYLMTQ